MTEAENDARDLEVISLLAEALPMIDPPPAARSRFRQALQRARFAPFAREIADKLALSSDAVLRALERVGDDDAWIGLPTGLRILPIHGRVVIARLRAGTRIPRHHHATREFTYVLEGALVTAGVEHRRAACLDMAPGTQHDELRVSEHADCTVVFARF
jgi:anti-sigma factor ChrR (cupin superfamily)